MPLLFCRYISLQFLRLITLLMFNTILLVLNTNFPISHTILRILHKSIQKSQSLIKPT